MALIPVSELPKTRLELRWRPLEGDPEYNVYCDYDLVLELSELDIRGEVYNDEGEVLRRERKKRVPLGGTKTRGGPSKTDLVRGEIYTPYRDGAHIRWDGKRLGLRMFVVDGQFAMEMFQGDKP